MAVQDDYVPVADFEDLQEAGRLLVDPQDRHVALFHHEGEVYAIDNRCPHMGFPLTEGTVEEGILTCHWHHARFELACGDTFDIWADDVQTFPTAVEDGTVYVDPDPEPDVPPETHWRNRLVDGMAESLSLVIAKSVIHLDDLGQGFQTPLETAVSFGTTYRAAGWGRGLTTLGAMANLHGYLDHTDKQRAMYVGIGEVADNCAGEPPRFDQYALDNQNLSKDRLKSWFRETCEVRDEDGAERCLRTAAAALPPEDVAEIVVAAATDHLYMNTSHALDFWNKAFETLEHVGWSEAPNVLASCIPQLTDGSRAEETSSWRQPIDVADLVFDAHDRLDDLVAAGAGETWERPADFVETLLEDDPHTIVEALTDAIAAGASAEQLADAVADAATRRVAQFATSNEFGDWDTVHHTYTYANAAHQFARRTDATDAYRPCFDGAMSVYLDRFLNQPAAPIPDGDPDSDPEAIHDALLDTFDEQGRVNEAGQLVADYVAAGGDADALIRTLGEGLLREDAGFHTLQSLEVAVERVEQAETRADERLPLIATARYMAAHFPTRREREQTFEIARRLFQGEAIHEG
ncbi:MAG: Rieske (2Fe-2S) protein [Halapricum sp.]